MLLAISVMLPMVVLPVRMVMRGLIAIMTRRVVFEIRANPRHARNRTDRPVKHRQSEHHGDDLGARWADDDHETEYSTSFRSVRLERAFHFNLPPLICETDTECVSEIPWEGAAIHPRPLIDSPSQRGPDIAQIL